MFSKRSLLPRSLRSRLILSFGLVILISLCLAGTLTAYLLKSQQDEIARERVGRLSWPVLLRGAVLEASGLEPEEMLDVLQAEYGEAEDGVRILLMDGDTIVSDSGQTLVGARIAELGQQGVAAGRLEDITSYSVRKYNRGPENLLLFLSPQGPLAALPGSNALGVPRYQAVVAVDENAVNTPWRDLFPRLFLAGSVAFMASVIVAGLLARSITRPLRRIATASEEMARGRYDQRISSDGGEEAGRLATAFNEMAVQVGNSYRTLRDFLANVSHELKTPLTSIQGFSGAMIDGSLKTPAEYADAARIINDESVRMRGLVDDLLYLSQLDARAAVFRFENVDPKELLVAADERFRRRARLAGVDLSVQAAEVPLIEADGRRLEQAVANIVDNALRYTPQGGRITLSSTADNGDVRLSIHNTGSVIPEKAMPHLFERFFQVDPAKSRADGNTGLGLAITREIVDAHKGRIDVTSNEVDGTEFVITVPASTRPIDVMDSQQPRQEEP